MQLPNVVRTSSRPSFCESGCAWTTCRMAILVCMTVAVVGLGAMGSRIAGRLLDAGYDIVVWNRTAEKAAPLVERGATLAASPADAAARAEALITMLTDPAALESVA